MLVRGWSCARAAPAPEPTHAESIGTERPPLESYTPLYIPTRHGAGYKRLGPDTHLGLRAASQRPQTQQTRSHLTRYTIVRTVNRAAEHSLLSLLLVLTLSLPPPPPTAPRCATRARARRPTPLSRVVHSHGMYDHGRPRARGEESARRRDSPWRRGHRHISIKR